MADKSEDSKVLTKEIAEQFVADQDSVNLSEFTAIDDDAAGILAKKFHDGLNIASLSENVQSKLDSCKLLVDYSHYTGEIDLCGLFITSIGDFRKCEGKSHTLVNDNEAYEVDFDELLSIRSRDQELIAKLQAEYGGRELLLGDYIIRNQIERFNRMREQFSTVADLPENYVERPDTITNSNGMKLVRIPAGTFMMGSPEDEVERSDGETLHQVTLSQDYYMGVFPVTQAEYFRVMGVNPSHFQGDAVDDENSASHPVENVTWEEAVEFCRKLSERPEERDSCRVYRLPTEAEWEYACRAGSQGSFCFGDDCESLLDYAWYDENRNDLRTQPVGLKKPNGWGLYDMHGNVCEWCADWYSDYPKGAVNDPVGPDEGSERVLRGGIWGSESCRSAFRNCSIPSERNINYGDDGFGFRVALSSSGIHKKSEK